jgi:Tfp pilus assembly protein PilF
MRSIKNMNGFWNKKIPLMWVLCASLMLVACASGPGSTPSDGYFADVDLHEDVGRAVNSLLAKAGKYEYQAQWERAASLLERALRIEPRNARLWHRLAKIRLQQGRYIMAQSLAQKSMALAKKDATLKRHNAELIDAARALSAQTDAAG